MRKTSKIKLLKEVEITEYSKPPLLGYQYVSATVIGFMATTQPTKFSKFERFSNVSDDTSFYWLLVIVPDRYNVELLIRSAERLRRTENLVQDIKITSSRKVLKSFQSYLNNDSNKTNMVKNIFQQLK